MKRVRSFLIAVQFLTRLPVPLRSAPDDSEIGGSVLFYPLIGALIGAGLAAGAAVEPGEFQRE